MEELQNLITGLEGSLRELRSQKEMFVRVQGMETEAEKLRQEGQKAADLVVDLKLQVAELQSGKFKAIAPVISGMSAAMKSFLPGGMADLRILDGGSFFIGWVNGGLSVPYAGLSGGEKVSFDAALAKALGATVLCGEVAELDEARLEATLEKYADSDLQIILASCHPPKTVPAGWECTDLSA